MNMDTESLLAKQGASKRNTKHDRRRSGDGAVWKFAVLATLLLAVAAVAGYFASHYYYDDNDQVLVGGKLEILPQQQQQHSELADSMEAWSVGKKIHPPHPKKLHHGEVLYTTVEDPDVGRYYKREFLVPCGYGLLVFNVGPADTAMPYAFDVFDDGYVFSDNGGLCWLYPSYRAHQNDTEPFWMPTDATEFRVSLGNEMQKISTRINQHEHTKDDERKSDMMKLKGGDYLIMVCVCVCLCVLLCEQASKPVRENCKWV